MYISKKVLKNRFRQQVAYVIFLLLVIAISLGTSYQLFRNSKEEHFSPTVITHMAYRVFLYDYDSENPLPIAFGEIRETDDKVVWLIDKERNWDDEITFRVWNHLEFYAMGFFGGAGAFLLIWLTFYLLLPLGKRVHLTPTIVMLMVITVYLFGVGFFYNNWVWQNFYQAEPAGKGSYATGYVPRANLPGLEDDADEINVLKTPAQIIPNFKKGWGALYMGKCGTMDCVLIAQNIFFVPYVFFQYSWLLTFIAFIGLILRIIWLETPASEETRERDM